MRDITTLIRPRGPTRSTHHGYSRSRHGRSEDRHQPNHAPTKATCHFLFGHTSRQPSTRASDETSTRASDETSTFWRFETMAGFVGASVLFHNGRGRSGDRREVQFVACLIVALSNGRPRLYNILAHRVASRLALEGCICI
ncbi:hypothetical protein P171DRAFT_251462 [Karstenula rhodostoma CBS 690.94]|uniref:Uncharacterized protein n=1 Tax=Karstenula rhodostoma CBS 690.94 TaxID=1392251 RepID=A0A9P4PMV5_9PLEO|nr:hypothetical protein P171DRAFT_251462 [Karstenula rhodostoma CBS 690.94]